MTFDLLQELDGHSIELLEERQRINLPELRTLIGEGRVAACDFRIEGIENGENVAGGYLLDEILNVDHHAPTLRMERPISSTHLALDHVQAHGPLAPDWRVLINHTDTDSVLSSLIVRGLLPPEDRFGQAALAADHTGAANPISDLLQGAQQFRNLIQSVRNLAHHLADRPLEVEVQAAMDKRHSDRQRSENLVSRGAFHMLGPVAFATLDEKLDAGLLPSLLPKAAVILAFSPMKDLPGHMEVKARLGLAAPIGTSLLRLGIDGFDPAFGGRWNAGSNKRGGGTSLSPEEYVLQLGARLAAQGVTGAPTTHGGFRGDHAFLSNFYPCTLLHRGVAFRCSEAAYMAEKCCDEAGREAFSELDGPSAKDLGHSIQVRPDWENYKLQAMCGVIASKFEQNPILARMLVATGDLNLVEYNTWDDHFWGVCRGTGLNWLGRLLMDQREALLRLGKAMGS